MRGHTASGIDQEGHAQARNERVRLVTASEPRVRRADASRASRSPVRGRGRGAWSRRPWGRHDSAGGSAAGRPRAARAPDREGGLRDRIRRPAAGAAHFPFVRRAGRAIPDSVPGPDRSLADPSFGRRSRAERAHPGPRRRERRGARAPARDRSRARGADRGGPQRAGPLRLAGGFAAREGDRSGARPAPATACHVFASASSYGRGAFRPERWSSSLTSSPPAGHLRLFSTPGGALPAARDPSHRHLPYP